jgi:class 3 adenylate cyclase
MRNLESSMSTIDGTSPINPAEVPGTSPSRVPRLANLVANMRHSLGFSRRQTKDSRIRPIRMGFILDVVGYGDRSARARARTQERLAKLKVRVLDDLNVELADTVWQGTGDGILLFLPKDLDLQRALPLLLRSVATHLDADNEEFQDQIRLRMAVDAGPVSLAPLGFEGAVATNLGRLVDSTPPRDWLADHPDHDLAVVVSDRLHSFVVDDDVPHLPPAQFTHAAVQVKELTTAAWLWTGGRPVRR